MPTPTIPAGNLFMNATLYTGTGATQAITNGAAGQSFQPDFVWIKNRSSVTFHSLWDSNRGVSAGGLASNDTMAEQSSTAGNDFVSFNSNGFSVGPQQNWNVNGSSTNLVGWNWKAGGTAVTNTSGSISAQVSANTTSGFSVVTYTGTGSAATIGHGLGVAPSMVIVKLRGSADNWVVYNSNFSSPANDYLILNSTGAKGTSAGIWGATATSTVFSIGGSGGAGNFVAYCWTPIAGYSAFGSYTGNGSADGPFVYLGFRPRFVLIKASSRVDDWKLIDTSRDTYNLSTQKLYPNLSAAENGSSGETSATNTMDILSNGFKLRTSNSGTNESAATYIYACFAENPFKYANAR
jgi:hypothetical protein